MSYYYMVVTPDVYELPIAVEESSKQLSGMLGVSSNSISVAASSGSSGRNRGFKIIKIEKGKECNEK